MAAHITACGLHLWGSRHRMVWLILMILFCSFNRADAAYAQPASKRTASPAQTAEIQPDTMNTPRLTINRVEALLPIELGRSDPALIAPVASAPTGADVPLQPTFAWSQVPGARYYELEISRSDKFAVLEAREQAFAATYTLVTPLQPGVTYYWRVRARQADQAGEYSSPVSFTTAYTVSPTPVLLSIGPDSITEGSGDFTLQVVGSGFTSRSVVQWNGQTLATTQISSRQLTASVPGSRAASASAVTITVFTPGPGGGTSAARMLAVQAQPLHGDCAYVQDFSTDPPSPSSALDVSIRVSIRGTFPNLRAARLSVIGRESLGTFYTEGTQTWNTRATPDEDYTLLLEIDDTQGSYWDHPARCTRSYHLGSRPAQTPPAPQINSLSPESVSASGAGLFLHVYGANFQPDSLIRWQGRPLETIYYSPGELGAAVPTGWAAVPQDFAISVVTPGADASGSLPLHVNQAATIQLKQPANGLTLPAGSVTFEWQSGAAAGYYTLRIWKDGAPFYDSSSVSAPSVTVDALAEGRYTWQVTTTSPAAGSGAPWVLVIRQPDLPAPSLTDLSPAAEPAGSAGITLRVNGSGFTPSSRIRWNGYELPTTYNSSSNLQAEIPAGYLGEASSVSITTATPAPGGGVSNTLTFTVTPKADSLPPRLYWIWPVTTNGGIKYAIGEDIQVRIGYSDASQMRRVDLYRWDALKEEAIPIETRTKDLLFTPLNSGLLNPGWNQIFARGVDMYDNGATIYFWVYRSTKPAAPQITALTPATLAAGSSEAEIGLSGVNFTADSIVWMDGKELKTEFQSNGTLRAWVPGGMLSQSGQRKLQVSLPGVGSSVSAAYSVMVEATGACSPAFQLETGGSDTYSTNGPGSTDQISAYPPWAANETGPEYTYRYTPQVSSEVQIALTSQDASLDLMLLDGTGGVCSAGWLLAFGDQSIIFNAEAGHLYYIVVDGFDEAAGPYTIRINGSQPKPVLLDASPRVISASAPQISLYGSAFTPTSVARINGVNLKTDFISDTQLLARLPVNFPYPPGEYSLVVFNPAPGGGISDSLRLRVDLANFLLWIPAALRENR